MADRLDPDTDYAYDATNQRVTDYAKTPLCDECGMLATHMLGGVALCGGHYLGAMAAALASLQLECRKP